MATGWQTALSEYNAGRGGYIVPNPNEVSSCQELLSIKGKLTGFRDDLRQQTKNYSSQTNIDAIMELIRMMNARIAEYDVAIQSCYNTPAPSTGAGATDDAHQGQVDPGSSTPSTDKLNPNGPAAQTGKPGSNTKIIVLSLLGAAVLITAAIIIRKRMKK